LSKGDPALAQSGKVEAAESGDLGPRLLSDRLSAALFLALAAGGRPIGDDPINPLVTVLPGGQVESELLPD